MDIKDQLEAIKRIMGKGTKVSNLDKIKAIQNWYSLEGPSNFNLEFIDSLYDQVQKRDLSPNQEKSLDNILKNFEIEVSKYI